MVDKRGKIIELGGFTTSVVNRIYYRAAPDITLSRSTQDPPLDYDIILTATDVVSYNNDLNKTNIGLYTLKKSSDKSAYSNNGSIVLKPQYGMVCPVDFLGPSTIYRKTIATSAGVTTNINVDLEYLINNVNKLSNELNVSRQYANTIDKLSKTSSNNITTSNNFYDKQQDLNKTINEYNGELENFNNISFYYKLVIAFSILLTIIILVIFGTKSIDNNSKISVYVIIIVLIIIAFIIYKQYSGVKEGFTIIYKDSESPTLGDSIDFAVGRSRMAHADIPSVQLYTVACTGNIQRMGAIVNFL
jgi:hypothetical protein